MLPSSLRTRFSSLHLSLCIFGAVSVAFRVTPGSTCAATCQDDVDAISRSPSTSATNASEIVCDNVDYWSTTTGSKYRDCINCLQNSTAVNGSENDLAWYLYNLRYTVDVCLFLDPISPPTSTSSSSPCASTSYCQPLRTALETGNLNGSNASEFAYCTADSGVFEGTALNDCIQCLQADAKQTYLANFLTALSAGCQQRPPAGDLLGLNGTLFASSAVSIINPPWNQTATTRHDSGATLATGTIIGIVAAAGALLLGGTTLFCIYWQRQRRRRHQRVSYLECPSLVGGNGSGSGTPPGRRQMKSISSSISGGHAALYTTDYKTQPGSDRDFELHDKIRTQHVVLPAKTQRLEAEPKSGSLFGQDTPYLPRSRQQRAGWAQLRTPPPDQDAFNTSQHLDEMPTHPAFIPRAFTRPSRGPPVAFPSVPAPVRSYKPDDYAAQQYVNAAEDVASSSAPNSGGMPATVPQMPPAQARTASNRSTPTPPPPFQSRPPVQKKAAAAQTAAQTHATTTTTTSTSTSSSSSTTQEAAGPTVPPPPLPPPPRITPTLVLPSLSRIRTPKKYTPPPLNIREANTKKARRLPPEDRQDQ
ncbi:hypothetical protein SPI_04576 [Niveomyces insectorum RCEF 264]|uniref:LPXTG-domain-containing protein n=1 Tax=Niveomyces insectorum RCEF 264 TaxID=1081102 RepID=A0A167UMJ6_9HYPO|nr:hypothetical protein SPI_04576 [Niveomyces insectorum RCEF 264]